MWNILMLLFYRPKIVIAFRTHGCMGHIYEFLYVGYVTKSEKVKDFEIYKIQPLVKGSNEHRELPLEMEKCHSYELQYLGFNLYVVYK